MCNCDGAIIVLTALVFLKFVEVVGALADWAWRTKMAKQCDEVFAALMTLVPPPRAFATPAEMIAAKKNGVNPFTFGSSDKDKDEGGGGEDGDGDKKEE